GGVQDVHVAGRPAVGVGVAAVAVQEDVGRVNALLGGDGNQRPGPAGVLAAVDAAGLAAGHGGVHHHLAVGQRRVVHQHLEGDQGVGGGAGARKEVVALHADAAAEGQRVALAVEVDRAVQQRPGGAAVHAAQQA